MQERGKTIVLITHDPETAFWADRVVHIRDGRLLTDEQEKEFVRQHAAQSATGTHAAPGAHVATGVHAAPGAHAATGADTASGAHAATGGGVL